MNIAAVPDYLGKYLDKDFEKASPSLRFGMYLQVWEKQDFTKAKAKDNNPLKQVGRLNDNDRDTMKSLLERQQATFPAASTLIGTLQLDAVSISPFTTGLGNEHPLENGFAFMSPFGLPYLPGSGVKGVLRQAAHDLACGEWGNSHDWDSDKRPDASDNDDNSESPIGILFGKEDGNDAHRGALTFWDVIPQIKGDQLSVEIMTPHYGHYYQAPKNEQQSPHDCGEPNPISFLTIPPGSGFTFYVQCNLDLLKNQKPDLAEGEQWKVLLEQAFEYAFTWLGFGAKTSVGYGAMKEDEAKRDERIKREREKEEERARQNRKKEIDSMDPIEKAIAQCLEERSDKNQPEINALIQCLKNNHWDVELAKGVASKLKDMMREKKKWREKSMKKNPDKDKDYQNTQFVIRILNK